MEQIERKIQNLNRTLIRTSEEPQGMFGCHLCMSCQSSAELWLLIQPFRIKPGRGIKFETGDQSQQSDNPKKQHTSKSGKPPRSTDEIWPGQQGYPSNSPLVQNISKHENNQLFFFTKQANLHPFYFPLNHETLAFCPKHKQTITREACYGLQSKV